MRKAVAVVVLAAFAVAACSGSDEPASTAVTEPTTTVAEPAITTEAATTSTVETTTAPTTTVDDEQARLRAAEQAYIESWKAYHAAILDPSNPDLRAEVERTYTGGNLEVAISALDGFVEADYVARANPEVEAEVSIVESALLVPGEADRAELIACEINSESYFEVGSRPDGGDALVRDEILVLRILVRIQLTDGVWKSESGEILSRASGDVECLD